MAEDSFKDFVLDQLGALPGLRVKAMFGGHGLYQGARFFGILMDGRLYFKTDGRSRPAYVESGMGPFVYRKARQTKTTRYYEVPPAVLENREDLVVWAQQAICAERPRARHRPNERSRREDDRRKVSSPLRPRRQRATGG